MIEVKKNINEPTGNLLRRFKNKVRQANVLAQAKSKRFRRRELSRTLKKKMALKRIKRQEKREYLRRWGVQKL